MSEFGILLTTSISLAFIHTIISVDHYIPFIVLSRSNNWTVKKTLSIVFVCSLGHVLSSVTLGLIGILLSVGVSLPINIENIRELLATYFLFAFGIVYTVYGIVRAVQNKPHTHGHGAHAHIHGHGSLAEKADDHGHTHEGSADDHNHVHDGHADGCGARAPGHAKNGKTGNVFWGLFILMVLCPCQPLIPILMYPASTYNMFALVAVTLSFAVCTIATMLTVTYLGLKGVRFIKLDRLERYSHVIAGAAILLCGVAVRMLPS